MSVHLHYLDYVICEMELKAMGPHRIFGLYGY